LDRPGGYTRIIRLPKRRLGDNGEQVLLQLVGKDEKREKKPKAKPKSQKALKGAPVRGGGKKKALSQEEETDTDAPVTEDTVETTESVAPENTEQAEHTQDVQADDQSPVEQDRQPSIEEASEQDDPDKA
jgi:large subunit ribosomal protein L17